MKASGPWARLNGLGHDSDMMSATFSCGPTLYCLYIHQQLLIFSRLAVSCRYLTSGLKYAASCVGLNLLDGVCRPGASSSAPNVEDRNH
jgi:hypothetical protein